MKTGDENVGFTKMGHVKYFNLIEAYRRMMQPGDLSNEFGLMNIKCHNG